MELITTSWWFQPIWKILVKMGIFPNRDEHTIYLSCHHPDHIHNWVVSYPLRPFFSIWNSHHWNLKNGGRFFQNFHGCHEHFYPSLVRFLNDPWNKRFTFTWTWNGWFCREFHVGKNIPSLADPMGFLWGAWKWEGFRVSLFSAIFWGWVSPLG